MWGIIYIFLPKSILLTLCFCILILDMLKYKHSKYILYFMAHSKKLKQLAATAICGNDLTSSILYVAALSIFFAWQYAWISCLMVVFVLYLYRKIYYEVVWALPLNWWVYNALLNTTSKSTASFAAGLTILSYIATAVISANEAIHYISNTFTFLPIIISTIVLLGFFAGLSIIWIKESSVVAITIFIIHILSITVLTFFIIIFLVKYWFSELINNFKFPIENNGWILKAVFFWFAASMLGVSGFESSSNFVEQQEEWVFPKTLKNMWIIVSVINPLMIIFALALFPIWIISSDTYQNTLLLEMWKQVWWTRLPYIISIDAFLVLSWAVLTSFVWATWLLERITLDRILPQYFIEKNNRWSSYRIIIWFLILCVSILLITKWNVKLLAWVYSISFLSVMCLFWIGNVLLKIFRWKIYRPVMAPWLWVVTAIIMTILAIIWNILMPPTGTSYSNFTVFLMYLIPTFILLSIMLNRTLVLKLTIRFLLFVFEPIKKFVYNTNEMILDTINNINKQEFVFFTYNDSLSILNKVMLYVLNNEHTKKIRFVTVLPKWQEATKELKETIKFLDQEYEDISVDFRVLHWEFTPELIRKLSKERKIPINFMFIWSPSNKFPYSIEELWWVRLII